MRIQSKFEEHLNTITHGFGAFLGIIGLGYLIYFDTHKTTYSFISLVIYGCSIIILFTTSTLYHLITDQRTKRFLRILDHISIYFLIAGTYTPVLLITLIDSLGWFLLYVVWGITAFGFILKLFFTGKYENFSTISYLIMGWLIVFDISSLTEKIGEGVFFLVAGGISYSIGIIFYVIESIPYNHVIWHLFVLIGALCHFIMVLNYII
tara:strand:- start:1381 stop:2004 length:624 start_codon:yes stop_codon:yes gene_type:complete